MGVGCGSGRQVLCVRVLSSEERRSSFCKCGGCVSVGGGSGQQVLCARVLSIKWQPSVRMLSTAF